MKKSLRARKCAQGTVKGGREGRRRKKVGEEGYERGVEKKEQERRERGRVRKYSRNNMTHS